MDETTPPPVGPLSDRDGPLRLAGAPCCGKLGIADYLAGGPQTAEALADATAIHAPSPRRVLRLLIRGRPHRSAASRLRGHTSLQQFPRRRVTAGSQSPCGPTPRHARRWID